jgi:phosphate starvation-inducible protein PhoH and related proteins
LNAQVESRELSLAGADNARLANFAGPMEQNLRHVEERLGVEVRRRGYDVQVLGPAEAVANAATVLARMFELSAHESLSPDRVHLCVQEFGFPRPVTEPATGGSETVVRTQRGGIRGRGPNQRQYMDQIRVHRTGRHGQDLSRGRKRRRSAAFRQRASHRAGATRGRSG